MPDGGEGEYGSGRDFYTAGEVCAAAYGMSRQTLSLWIKTGALSLGTGDKDSTDGTWRRFSWNRLVQIVLMAELTNKQRWLPTNAAYAALRFSDFGDAERKPGELYPKGETMLVAHALAQRDGSPPIFAKVVNVESRTQWIRLLAALHQPGTNPGIHHSFTAVHINPIIERIHRVISERARQ